MSAFTLFSAIVFCVYGITEIKSCHGDSTLGVILLACSAGLFYFN